VGQRPAGARGILRLVLLLGEPVRLDVYWVIIVTPAVLLMFIVGFRRWRKHKKETREWLSGEDSNPRQPRLAASPAT
jgi:hypothetical protein